MRNIFGNDFDKEVGKISERVERAILAVKIEEMMMIKEEEKELRKCAGGVLVLDLELFSYESYETTIERYKTEFSNFCAFETKNINRICSNFRERNNLNK